jgi:hypothetical protein
MFDLDFYKKSLLFKLLLKIREYISIILCLTIQYSLK